MNKDLSLLTTSIFTVLIIFCTSFVQAQKPALNHLKAFSSDYLYILGEVASLEGQKKKAIHLFEQIKQINPKIQLRLAQEYFNQGLYPQAQTLCQDIIQSGQKVIPARLLLAQTYQALNRLHPALLQYEKVLQLNPSHKEALFHQAVLSTKLKNPSAKKFSYSFQKNHHFHQSMGDFHFEQGRISQALLAFNRAFYLNPDSRYLVWRLFHIYSQQNQLQTFIQIMEDAQPSDSYIVSVVARAHLRQGHIEKTQSLIEDLLWDDPYVLELRAEWTMGLFSLNY